jgi:hypothetical protein
MTSALNNLHMFDHYRQRKVERSFYGTDGDATCGAFCISSPIDGSDLMVIASSDDGWDHVSVSRRNRCPNWPEMAYIKKLFFQKDATVMELHVPESQHINLHPNCLHLWRPQDAEIPRPPAYMVAPDAMENT